jgi:hypothetical protein
MGPCSTGANEVSGGGTRLLSDGGIHVFYSCLAPTFSVAPTVGASAWRRNAARRAGVASDTTVSLDDRR